MNNSSKTILKCVETSDKNLLDSIIDFSFTYPFIYIEILNLYKNLDKEAEDLKRISADKSQISGIKHRQNIFAIQMIHNYYMYQEQIFTWIFVLRDYIEKQKDSLVQVYLEDYRYKTIKQEKIRNLKDEFVSNSGMFIDRFIINKGNKNHYFNRLQKAFEDLFQLVHDQKDSERLELIYNKTKHGGFCLYSGTDFNSERPYVPNEILEKKGMNIFVEPYYLPTKLEIYEDIHSRIPLHQYPFLEIISTHMLQRFNVESEYKKSLDPRGQYIVKSYAQISNLLNKPLFEDF